MLEPDEELTIIVGPNAVGKTNIIEAVQLLTAADSFRHPQWSECVRWGASQSRTALLAEGDGRSVDVELSITSAGRRTYTVNGNVKRRLSEVSGVMPCVVFTPDDLRIVKDSADKRRAAIDAVGDQLSASYSAIRADYEKIVRQRNAVLKDGARNQDVLDSWTSRLIEVGSAYSEHRRRLFGRLAPLMSEAYERLSAGENLEATYVSSWEKGCQEQKEPGTPARQAMTQALESRASEERARGVTLVGPHRDDVVFAVHGKDARAFASQGQQRTIALAWKLAEVGVVREVGAQPPVLLLDDVMSELDEARRHELASLVGASAQTIVTTANLGYFDRELVSRARVVTLG